MTALVRRMVRETSRDLGLREQNKLAKRYRIRQAARELISKYGYNNATLRQIAERAHVGLGTLFNYAQDKRDLVFLVCNEDLANVLDAALEAQHRDKPLIDQVVEIYRPHYEYFAEDPAISRVLLKELVFYSEGKQADAFLRTRWRLISAIEARVRSAQKNGEIEPTADAATVTHLIFLVASGAIRWWIAGSFPEPNAGISELRRLLKLQFNGFRPRSELSTRAHDA